jgi:hypothetical protein
MHYLLHRKLSTSSTRRRCQEHGRIIGAPFPCLAHALANWPSYPDTRATLSDHSRPQIEYIPSAGIAVASVSPNPLAGAQGVLFTIISYLSKVTKCDITEHKFLTLEYISPNETMASP